jgi:hypothetical protein
MDQIQQFEVDQITASLAAQGVTNFTMKRGNNCVWVSYNSIDCYYIFKDEKLVNIQVD